MKTIRFEDKEYEIEPVGLKERFELIKRYKSMEKQDLDIESIESIYEDLISLICKKTNNKLDKNYAIEIINKDAIKGDDLIAQFMDSMVGDASKKR